MDKHAHSASPLQAAPSAAAVLCLLAAALVGCGTGSGPAADKDPAAAPSGTSSGQAAVVNVAPSATVSAAPAPVATIPTFVPERFDAKEPLGQAYPIEGAIMVAQGQKVGRLAGDKVEWTGSIPKGSPVIGENYVRGVYGRWPDAVDVFYEANNGRAPSPTYMPLTGKGRNLQLGSGGFAILTGVVRIGETTLLAAHSGADGYEILTMRGPKLPHKAQSAADFGCKEGETIHSPTDPRSVALGAYAIAASKNGTLVTVGDLCEKRGPAAEVWDTSGTKSTIVDLKRWIPDVDFFTQAVGGKDDEVWIVHPDSASLVRHKAGKFEPIAGPGGKVRAIVASRAGQVFALTGWGVFKWEDEKWAPVANLQWPTRFRSAAMDDEGTIWVELLGGSHRLREGKAVVYEEGCATPFVYLYEVSAKNPANFAFPSTQKALSTFPEVADISLVDFEEREVRSLGVKVTSKAQGEALIAHVRATMKDEDPRLLCFAPKGGRKVEIAVKK